MRKTLIITMLLVCVMALSFALAGCGDGNEISININNKNMVTKLKGNIASASSFEMDLLQDVQGGQTHKSIKVKGNLAKVDSIEANNTTTTYYEFVDDYVNEYSLDAVTDKWKIKKITGEEVKYYDYKEYCTLNLELALMMPNFKYNASKKAFVGNSNGIDYEVKVEKDNATIKIGNTVGTEKYYSTATIGNLNGDIVITLPTIEEGAPSIFDGVDITTKAGIEAVKNAIVTAKTFINTHENHCDNKQYSGNPDFVQTSRFENMKGSVDIKSTAYNVNSYIDCSGDKAYLYEFDTNENKWYKSALSLNGYTPSQYFTSSYAENLALMDKAISASDLAYDSTRGLFTFTSGDVAYTAKLVTEGIRFEYSITENLNENETATTSYVREITNINDETIKVTLPEAEIKKTSIFDGYDLESNQIFIHMKHYVADAKTFVYIDEYHHTDKVSFGNPDSVQINSVNNRKIKMDVNNTNSNIIGYADLSGDKLYMYQPNGEGVYVKSEIPIGNMTLDEYYNNMFAKYIRLLDLATNASDLVYDSATKSYTFTDNSITYTATIVDEGVKFEWSEDENMNNTPSVTTYRLEVNSLYGDVEVVLPTDCITQ